MKRLRFRVILLTCWLIIFYMMGLLGEPFNISLISYIFPLISIVVVLIPLRLRRGYVFLILTLPVILFIVIKIWAGLPFSGTSLITSLIEICAILLTTLLSIWVRGAIKEFEDAVSKVTNYSWGNRVEPASEGQSILYREVRRARNHQRPLVLLAIAVDEKSIKGSIDRMLKEAQQSIIKRFTINSVSRTLSEKLEDCDIVVQTNNHFLVVLPETKPEDVPGLIDRLRKQVAENVGVDLKIGTASLPQDGLTYEGLLDKANLEMHASFGSETYIEPEQLFAQQKIAKSE